MRARLAALATLVVATSLYPQQQPPLVESIEVRVTNVDVVVTDRKGNPILGLTKDDFELYDENVQQPITNFYEVRRGEDMSAPVGNQDVPLAIRQRRIALFVDSGTLTPSRKSAVLLSVEKFIDHMRPEDLLMLVTWRSGTEIVTPFTNDKSVLKKGLDTIAHTGPTGAGSRSVEDLVRQQIQQMWQAAEDSRSDPLPLITFPRAYEESRNIVTSHGHQLFEQERELLNTFDAVATTMAGLEGKKVLVFVAENLPENPAADMYRYVNNLFGPYLDRNQVLDFDTSLGVTGNDLPRMIEGVARDASANGITIYTIGAAASDSDFGSHNGDESVDYTYTFARDANTASSLQTIAEVTGGVAITRTSNFDLAFDTINRDLSSYYSLGYKPVAEGIKPHNVIVKVKKGDYRVRSRRSFIVKSSDEMMSDRTIANLYLANDAGEWPISVRIGKMTSEGGDVVVPIQVVIPSTLTLIPQEDKLVGGLTMYFATGDAAGRTSTVIRVPEDLRIPAAIEQTVRAKPMIYQTSLRVRAGENLLSVAIVDRVSGTMGFTRRKFVAR